MYEIDESNAFTINSLNGISFPFSVEIKEKADTYRLHLCPIQIKDFTDLINDYSHNYFVVINMDHSWLKNETEILTLCELANEQKMIFDRFDDEIIGFEKAEITKLVGDNLPHYNFEFFDLKIKPKMEDVEEKYLLFDDYNWNEADFLLDKENETSVYISSYDDCYLFVETTSEEFIKKIISRNIKIYSSTILQDKNIQANISDFPDSLLEIILFNTKTFNILQKSTSIKGKKLSYSVF